MAGFEPWISGIGSDSSTNCATTTALAHTIFTTNKSEEFVYFRSFLTVFTLKLALAGF